MKKNLITLLKERLPHKIRQKLEGSQFAQNALIMFLGTALGQMGTVILAPILTRVYSPEEFGGLGAFTAVVSVLSVIAMLRYEMALPLARDSKQLAGLVALCGVVLIGMTALVALGCALYALIFDNLAGIVTPFLLLLPVGFFAVGAYQAMVFLATKTGDFNEIAKTKILQGILGPVSQIVMGLLSFHVWGLMIGFVMGQTAGVTRLLRHLVYLPRLLHNTVTLAEIKELALRYKNFPLLSSWSGLLGAAGSVSFLLIVVPIIYSPAAAGFIFLIDRVVGRPLLIISTSILQAYMGDVAQSLTQNSGAIKRRFVRLAMQQAMIVTLWLIIVNIAATYLFEWAFGDVWAGAIPFLHILSVAYFFQMIANPLTHTMQMLERQDLATLWEVIRLVLVVGGVVWACAAGLTEERTLWAYSLGQALSEIIFFALAYYAIVKHVEKENAKEVTL